MRKRSLIVLVALIAVLVSGGVVFAHPVQPLVVACYADGAGSEPPCDAKKPPPILFCGSNTQTTEQTVAMYDSSHHHLADLNLFHSSFTGGCSSSWVGLKNVGSSCFNVQWVQINEVGLDNSSYGGLSGTNFNLCPGNWYSSYMVGLPAGQSCDYGAARTNPTGTWQTNSFCD